MFRDASVASWQHAGGLRRTQLRAYCARMKKILLLALLALLAVSLNSGCKSHSGSREFIPGKGWVPTK